MSNKKKKDTSEINENIETNEAFETAEADVTNEVNPRDAYKKELDPKELAKFEQQQAKDKERLQKAEQKREIVRAQRLKKFEEQLVKEFEAIDRAEAREKAKTKDTTAQREIELLAIKKREELTASSDQQRRIIKTATGSRFSYERKKSMYGYVFISIWIIGIIFVFFTPLVTSLQYSLSKTTMVTQDNLDDFDKMSKPGIHCEWNDFDNYVKALTKDPEFSVNLATSLTSLLTQVPLILIFSLFVAILLNQNFKGRTVMRAIFFFPVLIATGPVISVINGSMVAQGVSGDAAQFSSMFQTDMVEEFVQFLGLYNYLGETQVAFISTATSDIFNLLWKSGIQILIFLSALQQIPTSAKEAASMEGATAWEFFWKITFPTISPMILANLIYTIIDTFSDSQNLVMKQVLIKGDGWMFGDAAAMAWIYFGIIAIALAVVVGIVSKFVFYQVD